jgi:hypothetical protein
VAAHGTPGSAAAVVVVVFVVVLLGVGLGVDDELGAGLDVDGRSAVVGLGVGAADVVDEAFAAARDTSEVPDEPPEHAASTTIATKAAAPAKIFFTPCTPEFRLRHFTKSKTAITRGG